METKKISSLIALLLAVLLCFSGCSGISKIFNDNSSTLGSLDKHSDKVHFIDCWQGDCELIVSGGVTTLIDTGPQIAVHQVLDYLSAQGVTRIDNLVLTHPHEDHIGNAARIIKDYEIGKIYMSRPTAGTEPTTQVYMNLLTAIKDKGLTITTVHPDDLIEGGNFDMTVLGPVSEYNNLNNQSVVIRAVHGNISFLFMGDAEGKSEKDILERYGDSLKCNVLKVGHHGSNTSSTKKFLAAAMPEYAVISCGDGNPYKHPSLTALSRINQIATEKIYRTDTNGSIVCTSDGESISVEASHE